MQLARRPSGATDELQPIRDAVCLEAYNDLMPVGQIAGAIGKSRQTVWRWIKRAKENPRPPNITIWANDSGSTCRHGKPVVPGMAVLCIECWATGVPNHPAMKWGQIRSDSETQDKSTTGTEIAKSVQPYGPAKFKPNTKRAK